MKVKIDIECSPAEARAFFGLPNIEPLNDKLVEEMGRRMEANMDALEPEALMRNWMSMGGEMQKQMFALFTQAASPKRSED